MEKEQLTEKIIGCCFAVHRELGPGFSEKIYQNALQRAFEQLGIRYDRKKRVRVWFREVPVGDLELDLVVEEGVVVEVKAVAGVMPRVFEAQLLSYLKASAITVGLLVNFGNRSCHVKRLVHSSV